AQREETLLDRLEIARAATHRTCRRSELCNRFAGLDGRAFERAERRVEGAAGFVAQPLELAGGSMQRMLTAALAREFAQGGLDRGDQLLAVHEQRAPLRERVFLAGLRVQRVELGERVAEVIFIATRLPERRFRRHALGRDGAPGSPRRGERRDIAALAAIGVERF